MGLMLSGPDELAGAADTHPSNETTAEFDELLTVIDAARFLNVPLSWVYEHARGTGPDRLPVVKLGKYLRFDRRDLRAYIDSKREAPRTTRRRR